MSYASQDVSVQDGMPIYLFQFVQGATTYRYCALPVSVSYNGYTWLPGGVIPDKFTISNDIPKDVLSLKLPIDNPLATTFLGYAPDCITSVTVYHAQFDDLEAVVYWKGRVSGSTASRTVVTLECEPVFSSLKRPGIRATYSRTCRHALFGRGCNLVAADYAVSATATAVNRNLVTVPLAAAVNYLGGTIKVPDGTVRTIMAQNGAVLTMMSRVKSLEAAIAASPSGVGVTIYTGCDHSIEACRTRGNVGNFGGFVGIPLINPMNGTTPVI
jgi:hypothetical protein